MDQYDGASNPDTGLLLASLVLILSLAFQVSVFLWLGVAHALNPPDEP